MTTAHDPIRTDDGTERLTVVLARDVGAAGRARQRLAAFLRGRARPHQLDDAYLVVSELVTNGLRHGLGEVVLRASLRDGALHLAVSDTGEELPRLLPRDPTRVGGLGLHIVDQLTTEWGTSPFPGGKTVWATISLDA